jgi:hypothetical protein
LLSYKHAALGSGDGSPINSSLRLSASKAGHKEHYCPYQKAKTSSFHHLSFAAADTYAALKLPIHLGNSSVGNSW